jgi:hypothetical protein
MHLLLFLYSFLDQENGRESKIKVQPHSRAVSKYPDAVSDPRNRAPKIGQRGKTRTVESQADNKNLSNEKPLSLSQSYECSETS